MKRAVLIPLLSLLLAVPLGGNAAAEINRLMTRSNFYPFDRFDFDPAKCADATARGMYVSLGRSVFRWPLEDLPSFKLLESPSVLRRQPSPPDPSAAKGCASHPYALERIGFDIDPLGPRLRMLSPEQPIAFLELIFAPSLSRQGRHEENFLSFCRDERLVTPEGYVECRSYGRSLDEDDAWVTFKVPPELLPLPTGEPLYVRCSPMPTMRTCRGDFRLDENVYLGFEVLRDAMAIAEIVALTEAMLAAAESARVDDYVWAD
jgi:hypothetical protein